MKLSDIVLRYRKYKHLDWVSVTAGSMPCKTLFASLEYYRNRGFAVQTWSSVHNGWKSYAKGIK